MTDAELIARLRKEDTDFWHCEAADRIEALTKERDEAVNQQDSARHSVDVLAKRGRAMIAENAKLHDRIEALIAERDDYAHKLMQANNTYTEMHLEIERLSDKLAKAVEALEDISGNGNAAGRNPQLMADKARATLAEIKGESHELRQAPALPLRRVRHRLLRRAVVPDGCAEAVQAGAGNQMPDLRGRVQEAVSAGECEGGKP
jgi:chromosome segregation ATPase